MVKYGWTEPIDVKKWKGTPPKINVTIDERYGFILQAMIIINKRTCTLSGDAVWRQFWSDVFVARNVHDQSRELFDTDTGDRLQTVAGVGVKQLSTLIVDVASDENIAPKLTPHRIAGERTRALIDDDHRLQDETVSLVDGDVNLRGRSFPLFDVDGLGPAVFHHATVVLLLKSRRLHVARRDESPPSRHMNGFIGCALFRLPACLLYTSDASDE